MSKEEQENRIEVIDMDPNKEADPARDWVEDIAGTFKDDPEWEEVCRLGAELRQADQLQYDDPQ